MFNHCFPAGNGDGGSCGSPGLCPAATRKKHPEDAQRCQPQPLHPRAGSGTAGTALWGPYHGLSKGHLGNGGHSQCGDTGASRALSPPQVPAPNRLRTLWCSPADTRCTFLRSHPGKPAGSLFLRAPIKPPCLKFLLVLFHPGFCFACSRKGERADTARSVPHCLLHSGAPPQHFSLARGSNWENSAPSPCTSSGHNSRAHLANQTKQWLLRGGPAQTHLLHSLPVGFITELSPLLGWVCFFSPRAEWENKAFCKTSLEEKYRPPPEPHQINK